MLLNINKQMVLPHIVACSSYIDMNIIGNTKKAGFDQAVQCPMTIDTIRNSILPQI